MTQKKKPEATTTKVICLHPKCKQNGKPQRDVNFYKTYGNPPSVYPICKECIGDSIAYDGIDFLVELFRNLNIAFNDDLWVKSAKHSPENPFGIYLRSLSALKQYTKGPFEESQVAKMRRVMLKTFNDSGLKIAQKPKVVSKEIKEFFGSGYTDDEYLSFKTRYDFLKQNYQDSSAFHVEALRSYVIPKVKAEIAMAKGDDQAAKTWLDIANKAATNAKLNISQMTKADLQGGLSTFSEWAQIVEKSSNVKDIISVTDKFMLQPIDKVDFTIYCYINYIQKLLGKNEVSYSEIYKFYDKKKEDFIKDTGDPYGIFDNELKEDEEKMRRKIEMFCEPLGDE